MKKIKKKTLVNLHWLIGGIIGVIFGLIFSFRFIFHLDLPDPDIYTATYHLCTAIIVISVFLGAAFGTTIGKITLLLEDIYGKNEKG